MKGISFCISTWNRTDLLVKAIDSVLSQGDLDGVPYEIIVSADVGDNISQDVVASKYGKRVRFTKNKIKGQFDNMNNLISEARYGWLVFLHDDDTLDRNYVKEVFLKIKKSELEDLEIVYTGRNLINREGRCIGRNIVPFSRGVSKIITGFEILDKILCGTAGVYHPMVTGLAIKKDLVLRIGCFNTFLKVNADGLFVHKALFLAKKVKFINLPLFNYLVDFKTERSKVSKEGIVYREMKTMFDYIMDFMKAHWKDVMGDENYGEKKKYYDKKFYKRMVKINGPLLWTAASYEGAWLLRMGVVWGIARNIVNGQRSVLLNPKLYFIVAISLLPQKILRNFYKIYVRFFTSFDF